MLRKIFLKLFLWTLEGSNFARIFMIAFSEPKQSRIRFKLTLNLQLINGGRNLREKETKINNLSSQLLTSKRNCHVGEMVRLQNYII